MFKTHAVTRMNIRPFCKPTRTYPTFIFSKYGLPNNAPAYGRLLLPQVDQCSRQLNHLPVSWAGRTSASQIREMHSCAVLRHGNVTRPEPGTGIKINFQDSKGTLIKTIEANEGDDLLSIAHEHDIDLEGACAKSLEKIQLNYIAIFHATPNIPFHPHITWNILPTYGYSPPSRFRLSVAFSGACEGSVACSTCHVILPPEYYDLLPEPDDDENDMLDMAFGLTDTSRLGCQVVLTRKLDGMTATLPSATRNMFVDDIDADTHDTRQPLHIKTPVKSDEWKLSIILSWVVVVHMLFISFTTFYLLLTTSSAPGSPLPPHVSTWATFLGVSSAMLAAIQYAPQLKHTYKTKLVGALSIPMMCIQSPGAIFMVVSIALRPGTNWTSWITFAVAGLMQGSLLIMCIIWTFRQRRLGIDDFGNPVSLPAYSTSPSDDGYVVPGLVVGEEDPAVIRVALAAALESAAESDVRNGSIRDAHELPISEETPLLNPTHASNKGGWLRWIGS